MIQVSSVAMAVQGQSKQTVGPSVPGAMLAALLKFLVQPVQALAGEIVEHGQWRHGRRANRLAPLEPGQWQRPITDPYASLYELLRAVEASDGFIAVRQGNCFAVVASVNSLPVGHQLELVERAAAADHLRLIGSDGSGELARQLDALASQREANPNHSFERLVEQALKGLADYSMLGQSGLISRLRLEPASQMQQAKRLRGVLVDAIESLRPAGALPSGVLPREWHAYTILHDAYVDDVPNRDIMSKLYISEGTFNRQRRKALRSVAKAIWEATTNSAPQSSPPFRPGGP